MAHPRSRGENAIVIGMVREGMGSSPLTRGKHLCADAVAWDQGLIPAHAGKTQGKACALLCDWAHPRSRGENLTPVPLSLISQGSSPLTRGKPTAHGLASPCPRLIPAHAGKTVLGAVTGTINGAHPRSRGENCHWRGSHGPE